MIIPVITGWIKQLYGNEPALSKVNENESPGDMKPESKTPVSEVAVCVACPLFVQQTVVPTGTLMFAGSKKSSPIEISADRAGQPGAARRAGASPRRERGRGSVAATGGDERVADRSRPRERALPGFKGSWAVQVFVAGRS